MLLCWTMNGCQYKPLEHWGSLTAFQGVLSYGTTTLLSGGGAPPWGGAADPQVVDLTGCGPHRLWTPQAADPTGCGPHRLQTPQAVDPLLTLIICSSTSGSVLTPWKASQIVSITVSINFLLLLSGSTSDPTSWPYAISFWEVVKIVFKLVLKRVKYCRQEEAGR